MQILASSSTCLYPSSSPSCHLSVICWSNVGGHGTDESCRRTDDDICYLSQLRCDPVFVSLFCLSIPPSWTRRWTLYCLLCRQETAGNSDFGRISALAAQGWGPRGNKAIDDMKSGQMEKRKNDCCFVSVSYCKCRLLSGMKSLESLPRVHQLLRHHDWARVHILFKNCNVSHWSSQLANQKIFPSVSSV